MSKRERKGPFCGAKLRRRVGTCGRDAGAGTDHKGVGRCSWHGGCSPSGRAAAIGQQAAQLLYKYDADPVTDTLGALQRLAGRALELERVIGEKVNDLSSLRYETETGGEQLRAEVAVLERAMDRAARLLVDIAKLGIEERLAKVTEAQAELAQKAFGFTLSEMGFTAEQRKDAQVRLGRHLRAVG